MIFAAGGVSFDLSARIAVLGILNVTPDSFSDGGVFLDPDRAVEQAARLVEAGADIIDVGGESTRPGAAAVPVEEELARVIPVIGRIAGGLRVPVSIDTRKPEVARAAIAAGAVIVNDVGGLRDPAMAQVAAAGGASVIVMHMRGEPSTMQQAPVYDDLMGEIRSSLAASVTKAAGAGIGPERIVVDPGIGFGKTVRDNLVILNRLEELAPLGFPILIGASRKAFIGHLLGGGPGERLEGSLAAAAAGILHGARLVRVHDVAAHRRLADLLMAVIGEGDGAAAH